MELILIFKRGKKYSTQIKEINNKQHLKNYITLMSRLGYKNISIDADLPF
jgi:hypothetical protein